MLHNFVDAIVHLIGNLGYIGIFVMMMLESSFIPFPSEIAMIPAGYLASTGEMNFFLACLVGTLWAIFWASINYLLGVYLGWPIVKSLIHRYGKYIFLSENHYNQAEVYFSHHGVITTFLGRFIPAVRQLISLPAGIFKMNFFKFIFYTGLGALIWNLILMLIGYIAGENQELIEKYSIELTILILFFVVFIAGLYVFFHKRKWKKIIKK